MTDPELRTGKFPEDPGREWEDWEVIFHHFVMDGNSVIKRNKHAADLILNTAERKCIENVTRLKEFIKAGIGSENCDDLVELEITIAEVGFAWGFVLGQNFDFSDPQGKKSVQRLKGEIFQSGVLPYIALERKNPNPSRKIGKGMGKKQRKKSVLIPSSRQDLRSHN